MDMAPSADTQAHPPETPADPIAGALVWRCMVCRLGIAGALVPDGATTDGLCQVCKTRLLAELGLA